MATEPVSAKVANAIEEALTDTFGDLADLWEIDEDGDFCFTLPSGSIARLQIDVLSEKILALVRESIA